MISARPGFGAGRALFIFMLLAAWLTAPGCMKKRQVAPWPEETWASASPESQGLDSSVLAGAVRTIRSENINIHSILLIRNGFAVLDAVFYPYDGKSLHDVASVTKTITATLVGQAVSEGLLPGLDVPVTDLLPGAPAGNQPEPWSSVTLENLVTMSSGLDCGDPPVEETLFVLRNSPDWVHAALSLPVVETPGEQFDYCSPNFHLLSAAVARVAVTSLAGYARDRLFEPLGIDEYSWPADPQGVTIGWGDLRLHPYAMAKIGYLYMNDGLWREKRVLPAGWVKAATTPRLPVPGGNADYGYGWWLARGRFKGVYEARGRGGQSITVWPEADILLVTTGGGYPRDPVIDLLPEQRNIENKGSTMRLGNYPCHLVDGGHAAAAYGQDVVYERHRHRYEFNNEFREQLQKAGMIYSGLSPDGRLVEICELANHPWMVSCQFHPEFGSRPNRPHPLFRDFIGSAKNILREGDQPPLPLSSTNTERRTKDPSFQQKS